MTIYLTLKEHRYSFKSSNSPPRAIFLNLPLTLTLLHVYWLLLRLSRPPNVLQATGLVLPVYNAVSVLRSVSFHRGLVRYEAKEVPKLDFEAVKIGRRGYMYPGRD